MASSVFQDVSVNTLEIANAASAATHPVRKNEHDAALAGKAAASHTHAASAITGLAAAVNEIAGAAFQASDTVAFTYNPSGTGILTAAVRRKTGGHVFADADGIYISGLAAEGHTHEKLHDALAVTDSDTIAHTLGEAGEQSLSSEVRIAPSGGLKVVARVGGEGGGAAVDLGTAAHQAAAGNHTHALLHAAASATSSNSIQISVNPSTQVITASVRRKTSGLGSGEIPIQESSDGLFVSTGISGVAAGVHSHDVATSNENGFMSAEDKRKLDQFTQLAQPEMTALFTRHDVLFKDKHVGGRHRWGQNMEVLSVTLTAMAPTWSGTVLLGLEVDGVVVETVTIPQGSANTEVGNAKDFENIFVAADEYARWVCVSGVDPAGGGFDQAPALIDISMLVRAALDTIPELFVNAGGSEAGDFAADGYYNGGASGSTATAPDTSGVSTPAPVAVYQTWRQKSGSTDPLLYTLTGLGKGVNYNVRLHFCENFYDDIGDQIFDVDVIGATTSQTLNFDILAETSGVKFKAHIRESTLKADGDGKIVVKLTPRAGGGGNYRCSINGIEVVAV